MKLSYINISSFTNENAKQYIAQRFAENNRKGDSEQDIQNLINKIGLTPYLLKIATSYLIENPTEEISRYIEFLNPEDKDDLLWVTIENIDLEAVAIAWVLVRLDPTCLEKDFLIEKVFGKKGEEMLEELVKFSIISPTIKEGICVGYEIHKEVHRMLKEYFKDFEIDPILHKYLEKSENMLAKAVDAVSEIINVEYSKETDLDYIRIYINHAEQITHDTHTDGIKILSLYEKIVKFYEYSTQNAKERNI